MCGRYAIFAPPHKLKDLFGTENALNLPPRYNAAPQQELPVIVHNRMGLARWGFGETKMINARGETAPALPTFREAWAARRRCLVPADGFYEWKADAATKTKQAFYIHDAGGEMLAFAGLWTKAADGAVTFVILTKAAQSPLDALHERMPVLVPIARARDWFAAGPDEAQSFITQGSAEHIAYYPVSAAVGKVANDTAALIERTG